MGQLIILAGGDSAQRKELLGRACRLYRQLADLVPSERLETELFAACKFAKIFKSSTGIIRAKSGSGWACGAGTWLGDAGPVDALHALIRGLDDPKKFERTLAGVDGSFVLVVGSDGFNRCWVVTDRVGTIHAYSAKIGSIQLICTSSLILAGLCTGPWDPVGVREFLNTGTIYEQRTLFRNISKLEPATIYSCDDGELRKKTEYWRFDDLRYEERQAGRSVERLADALTRGMASIDREYDRPLLDLTGGYDSRAVVATAVRSGQSFETVVNGSDDNLDVIIANRIARHRGFRHHHQRPRVSEAGQWWSRAKDSLALCDGEYDILEYGRILDNHARLSANHDVSVNGSGGEFCKGYWWELLLPRVGSVSSFNPRRLAAGRFATDTWGDTMVADEIDQDLVEHFTGIISTIDRSLRGHPNTAKIDKAYLTLRMQRWQGRIASATNRIWPCLSPFMFREAMEAAFSTAPRIRFGNQMVARLIEFLDADLARVDLTTGYPAEPLRLSNIHRFAPLATEFLNKVWRKTGGKLRRPAPAKSSRSTGPAAMLLGLEEVRELLDVGSMRTRDLYRRGSVERFTQNVLQEGRLGESQVGRVLTLELLARRLEGSG